MNPLTLEWVNKAEEDFIAAEHLLRLRRTPVYSAVCFHCQQSAEKYLKAVLQHHQQAIPKVHNLADDFRYPGMIATRDDAKIAYNAAKATRQLIRQRLGLE